MKKALPLFISLLLCTAALAQRQKALPDSTTFRGTLYNKEFDVYMQLDLYHANVIVPNQEIYGPLPGFFGDKQDARKWLFTKVTIKSANIAEIQLINDYGSEDLTATLTRQNDTTFVLKQEEGSTLKIARNRKWVKLPKSLTFIKK